jgi:hypothetical protein
MLFYYVGMKKRSSAGVVVVNYKVVGLDPEVISVYINGTQVFSFQAAENPDQQEVGKSF